MDETSLVRGIHDEINTDRLQQVVKAFKTKGQHDFWAWKFYACECLTLANLFFQYFITDKFLQGEDHFQKVDYFQKVALQGWNTKAHVSVLPVTGLCYIKR